MFKLFAIITLVLSALQPPKTPEVFATVVPNFAESIERDFVAQDSPYSRGHRGIDLLVDSHIQSPVAGVVHFTGDVINRSVITIRSPKGLLLSFEPVCSELQKGEKVSIGQIIGSYCQGDEGYRAHCESCIHFSVRSQRGYLNPLLFYGLIRPSVLLA